MIIMRSRFAVIIIFSVIFLALVPMFSGSSVINVAEKVSAQTSNYNNTNMTGMIGPKGTMMTTMNDTNQNITSSVKIFPTVAQAIASQLKVSLSQGAMNAEKLVGNNSHATVATLGIENGYLVYTVWVLDGGSNFHRVTVDPGNGKVLDEKISTKMGPGSIGIKNRGPMMGPDMGMMDRSYPLVP